MRSWMLMMTLALALTESWARVIAHLGSWASAVTQRPRRLPAARSGGGAVWVCSAS